VYLASPETAAATAIRGVITDPRQLARDLGISPPPAELPTRIEQDDPNLVPPAGEAEAAGIEIHRGESIRPAPVKPPLEAVLAGRVLIKVGDDITTDHIMPAGPEIVAHRSNVPRLAEYVFYRMDPTFAARARASGGGFIVGGENYGQGSSREHAALAPMYLGVKGVIARSFSRIHQANLINWGLLPMVFADPRAYEGIDQGDELEIPEVRARLESSATRFTVRNKTRGTTFEVTVDLNPRERRYILAGGKLAFVKAHPLR